MIQEEFKANHIEFAHRNVTVYLPPEDAQTPSRGGRNQKAGRTGAADRKLMEKAGAAAVAAVQPDPMK